MVTGPGLITPLGNTVESTWKAVLSGESGADYITKFDATNFPVRFAAGVKNFESLDYFERGEVTKAIDISASAALIGVKHSRAGTPLTLRRVSRGTLPPGLGEEQLSDEGIQ